MASSFMADIGAMGAQPVTATKSTSRANNTEMKMEDFLKLMVVQLQSQTIDDTADTGEMLNQLVQMQMVTALSNMTDASVMSYASSLVGKEVTIGYTDKDGNFHQEVLNVIGTGVYNGQQVIFCDNGEMYQLNQIMGVGRIPELDKGEDEKGDETPEPTDFDKETKNRVNALTDSIKNGTFDPDKTDGADNAAKTGDIGAVKAPEDTQESSDDTGTGSGTVDPLKEGVPEEILAPSNQTDPAYDGSQGADTDGE